MRALAVLTAMAMVGVMMVPPAAAVHGSSYTAVGIAYISAGISTPPVTWVGPISVPGGTEVHKAVVLWTGYNPPPGKPYNHYEVTISDLATGAVVDTAIFPGSETWGCCLQGNYEFFQYHGCSSTGGWGSACVDAPHDFDVYGLQAISINTQQQWMLYSGWFNGWALNLVVESHVDDLA